MITKCTFVSRAAYLPKIIKAEFIHQGPFAELFIYSYAPILLLEKELHAKTQEASQELLYIKENPIDIQMLVKDKLFFNGFIVSCVKEGLLYKTEIHAKPLNYQKQQEEIFQNHGLKDILFQKQQSYILLKELINVDCIDLNVTFNTLNKKHSLKRFIPSSIKEINNTAIRNLNIELHLKWQTEITGAGNLLEHIADKENINIFPYAGKKLGHFTILDVDEEEKNINCLWQVPVNCLECVNFKITSNIDNNKVKYIDKKIKIYIHAHDHNQTNSFEKNTIIKEEAFKLASMILESHNKRSVSVLIPIEDALEINRFDFIQQNELEPTGFEQDKFKHECVWGECVWGVVHKIHIVFDNHTSFAKLEIKNNLPLKEIELEDNEHDKRRTKENDLIKEGCFEYKMNSIKINFAPIIENPNIEINGRYMKLNSKIKELQGCVYIDAIYKHNQLNKLTQGE